MLGASERRRGEHGCTYPATEDGRAAKYSGGMVSFNTDSAMAAAASWIHPLMSTNARVKPLPVMLRRDFLGEILAKRLSQHILDTHLIPCLYIVSRTK